MPSSHKTFMVGPLRNRARWHGSGVGAEPRHAQPKLKGSRGLAEAWLRHQGHGQLDAGVTNKMHVVGLPQFSPALPREPTPAVAAVPCDDRIAGHATAWEPHNQGQRRWGGPMRPDVVSQVCWGLVDDVTPETG